MLTVGPFLLWGEKVATQNSNIVQVNSRPFMLALHVAIVCTVCGSREMEPARVTSEVEMLGTALLTRWTNLQAQCLAGIVAVGCCDAQKHVSFSNGLDTFAQSTASLLREGGCR